MSVDTGTGLVLAAGTITFANEWLQTNKPNFRVPIATLLAAGAIAAVGKASPVAGTGIGVMILIGALVTKFNGKSPVEEISSVLPGNKRKQKVVTVV